MDTIKKWLSEEFTAAISAVFGDKENEEYENGKVTREDILEIANKVCFYLDIE